MLAVVRGCDYAGCGEEREAWIAGYVGRGDRDEYGGSRELFVDDFGWDGIRSGYAGVKWEGRMG